MKIAIVTDSTAVLSEKTKQSSFLHILNIPVIIDGTPQYDIPANVFYQRLKDAKNFPTTSQPSPGETLALYEQLHNEGYDHIISIHISSGISGFCQTLKGLLQDHEEYHVSVFDSYSTSLPMGVMVDQAVELVHRGASVDEIIDALYKMREAQCIYLIVDDLHHLVRSGRLTNGAALIGSLLQIKPILKFDETGHIVVNQKIRTAKKAYKKAEALILEELDFYRTQGFKPILGIAHANYEDKADELAQALSEKTGLEVRIADLGTVIGTHTGSNTIGFGIMRNIIEEEEG